MMRFPNDIKKENTFPINNRKMNGYICTISEALCSLSLSLALEIPLRFCVQFLTDFLLFSYLFSYNNKKFHFFAIICSRCCCKFETIFLFAPKKNMKLSACAAIAGPQFMEPHFTFISWSLRMKRSRIKWCM